MEGDKIMGIIIEKDNRKETKIKPKLVFVMKKNGQMILKLNNARV